MVSRFSLGLISDPSLMKRSYMAALYCLDSLYCLNRSNRVRLCSVARVPCEPAGAQRRGPEHRDTSEPGGLCHSLGKDIAEVQLQLLLAQNIKIVTMEAS